MHSRSIISPGEDRVRFSTLSTDDANFPISTGWLKSMRPCECYARLILFNPIRVRLFDFGPKFRFGIRGHHTAGDLDPIVVDAL